jgi:glutamate---cysteine ligase / carboxylate-amine ligase
MASIRPKIAEQLPRQGMPPAIGSWEELAAALAWGAAAGAVPEPRQWWWELRPHPAFGTLEVRVPDAQATVADAAAVTALVHALCGWLAARHDAGEALESGPTWRIEENRWSAARWGMDARLADLRSGERIPARERLAALVAELGPVAERLGCAAELADASRLADENGAARQRAVAADGGGLRAVVAWLADVYV